MLSLMITMMKMTKTSIERNIMKSQYVVLEVTFDPEFSDPPRVWDWNTLAGDDVEVLFASEVFDADVDDVIF